MHIFAAPGLQRPSALRATASTVIASLTVAACATLAVAWAPPASASEGQIPAPDGSAWTDTDGESIEAHGGSVVQVSEAEVSLDITGDGDQTDDVWLWYGEDKTHATRPVDGVRGYWSTDLVTWNDMGLVLPSHQFFTLTVDGGEVVVDPDKLAAVTETAELAAPTADVTQEQIDDARAFVTPYVETWADVEAGIPATYNDELLAQASYRLNGNINIMERPKMLWNAKTQKFVIIYHADGPLATNSDLIQWVNNGGDPSDRNIGSRYSRAEMGFATSDTPWGPFTLVNTTKMNWTDGVPNAGREGDARDMTVFQDTDVHTVDATSDDAYAVYSSEMNKWMYVSRLNADYTGPLEEGNTATLGEDYSSRVLPDFSREASSVFKHDGWYYMITSGTDGWASTPVVAYRSRSMITDTPAVVGNNNGHPATGQWERLEPANPCVGDAARSGVGNADPSKCFDSQPTFVIPVDAEQGQFVYMGDRWIVDPSTGSAGAGSRYVWAPIQVSEDGFQIENLGAWDPHNATVYEALPATDLTVDAAAIADFDPALDFTVAGQEFTDIHADWNADDLAAASAGGGTYTVSGTISSAGPLAGRQITANVTVEGLVDVCAEPGTNVTSSFHQTEWETLPASLACDSDAATSWSTWASNNGAPAQATLTAAFAAPWDLSQVNVVNTEGTIAGISVEYRDSLGQWHPIDHEAVTDVANGTVTGIGFEPVTATAMRVTFDTPGSYLKVSTLAMLGEPAPPAEPVNMCVADGTTASASFSQTQYGAYPAALACDGDTGTSWSTWASAGTRPDEVSFTAESASTWNVSEVAFTLTEQQVDDVRVEYRDEAGGDWTATTPASFGAVTVGEPTSLEFDAVDATAVRVTFEVNGSWVKIPEIEVVGTLVSLEDPSIAWEEILVDGDDVERDSNGDAYNHFGGFGAVSANNTSNLLMDYKEEHPDVYWDILEAIFDPDTGAGLNHIKVELGGDVDTSSGTEPATKRSESEPANVLRGAGFHLVADALTINPDIKVEALRWAEPSWTEGDYDKRFAWYLETMEAAYDDLGIEFDYMSPSQNEVSNGYMAAELDWTVWFAKRLAEEADSPDARYDYADVKIVALDSYRNGENVATRIINHPDAVDWIDVVGYHYSIAGGENLTRLNEEFGMELLCSEGISPMIEPEYRLQGEPDRGGVGGTTSMADIADRFIAAYRYSGAGDTPAHMTSFLFQPAISSMYEGVRYTPKSLIQASDPWSGHYEGGSSITAVRHFHQFMGNDWEYIEGATFADGATGDGGTVVDSSSRTYMTTRTPAADSGEADFTQVHANNTSTDRHFEVKVTGLSQDADRALFLWETTGPQADGEAFDARYFQERDPITPVRTETIDGVDYAVYQVHVQPYSILTLTTLDGGLNGTTESYTPGEYASGVDNTALALPYEDDFEYADYGSASVGGEELSYVERRGGNPRYTSDHEGAFEVVASSDSERGNVLEQKIHADNRPFTWNVWGNGDPAVQSTAAPYTTVGDHTWVNYTASVDAKFDTVVRDASFANYASVGVRQNNAPDHAGGFYSLRLHIDGSWEVRRLNTVVASGSLFLMDPQSWHNLSLTAQENVLTASIDGDVVATYTDTSGSPMLAGRVSLGSGFANTQFDNLAVTPIDGAAWESTKIDDSDPAFVYDGAQWRQEGFVHFNRTRHSLDSGDTATLDFEGSGLTLFGATSAATLAVSVDGGSEQTVQVSAAGNREASYWLRGLAQDEPHSLTLRVVSGTYFLDGADVITGGAPATVDPEDMPVEVTEDVDRTVVTWGDDPQLPDTLAATSAAGAPMDAAVEWLLPSAQSLTPFVTATVTGRLVNNPALTVEALVEVVPAGTQYFVDAGSATGGTPAAVTYPLIAAHVEAQESGLLNATPDARVADGLGWGAAAAYNAKGWVASEPYSSFSTTGRYTAGAGTPLEYEFDLPAGEWIVTSGHYEWWNPGTGKSRTGEVTVVPSSGDAVSAGTYSFVHPSAGASAVLSAAVNHDGGPLTYRVANAGGTEAPAVSWIAIYEAPADVPVTDKQRLSDLLDEAAATSSADYTAQSWFAMRTVALEAKAVFDDAVATQADVDAAADALEDALSALVEVPSVPMSDYRIATYAGVVPTLPQTVQLATTSGDVSDVAVHWDTVDADAVATPYDTVWVSGQAGTTRVNLAIEVVPAGLTYFVDAAAFVSDGTTALEDSPAHAAIAALTGASLLNELPDQQLDGQSTWGLVQDIGDGGVGAKGLVAGAYDKNTTTGWWLGGNAGDSIDYSFELEPGTYDITAAYHEWWGQNRSIQPSVKVGSDTVEADAVNLSGAATEHRAMRVTVDETQSVTVSSALASGTQLPVLSWIGVARVQAPLAGLDVVAGPDRTEYEVGEAFDVSGLEVHAQYEDGSTRELGTDVLRISGFTSEQPGDVTVEVAYTEGDLTQTATFVVTVVAPAADAVVLEDPATGVRVIGTSETLPDSVALAVTAVRDGGPWDAVRSVLAEGPLALFDIVLSVDGDTVQPSGQVWVEIPVPAHDGTVRWTGLWVADDGSDVLPLTIEQRGDYLRMPADHFSVYGAAGVPTDVDPGDGGEPGDGSGSDGSGSGSDGDGGDAGSDGDAGSAGGSGSGTGADAGDSEDGAGGSDEAPGASDGADLPGTGVQPWIMGAAAAAVLLVLAGLGIALTRGRRDSDGHSAGV